MKSLSLFAAAALLLCGCAADSGRPVAGQGETSPPGTNVGTSNPGINQPTTSTTATRSDDTGSNGAGGLR